MIEAFRNIKNKCKQTKENIKLLKEDTIYGREISGTAKIAKMNMIIIGDGHTNIQQMDSLKSPVNSEFNIVLTNFPFSQTTDYSSLYGFNSEDANPVFMKHILDSLVDGGIAGVVVPEGLLFDENIEYVKIRRILLETCDLRAVIKLHEFVFKPYTGQPTSILIFQKGKRTERVWFFDAKEDGFKKTGSKLGRSAIEKNDLILLRQIWKDKENSDHSFTVDIKKIQEQNYKLSMDKYRQRSVHAHSVKLGDVCDILIGGTPSRRNANYWGGNNSWAKIRDMHNTPYILNTDEKITDVAVKESNVKLLKKGTLLFSFKLTIGKVSIAGKDIYTNEAIAGIVPRDNKRVLSKYLYYLLPRLDYTTYTQRATKGKTLNKDIIKLIEIPLPSLKIQNKIVKKLDKKEMEKVRLMQQFSVITESQDKEISDLL